MPWKTISPTSKAVKAMSEILDNISVETLIQDAVSDMTLEERQELVDDTKKAISEYISGTAQYYDGTTADLIKEVIEENSKIRNAFNKVKSSKVGHFKY